MNQMMKEKEEKKTCYPENDSCFKGSSAKHSVTLCYNWGEKHKEHKLGRKCLFVSDEWINRSDWLSEAEEGSKDVVMKTKENSKFDQHLLIT